IAKSKQRNRRPDVDEMSRLMDWYGAGRRKPQLPMQDIILFAMFAGRRLDEICSITWLDLDTERNRVLVRDMKHPSLKIDTWVDLPDRAMAVVMRQPRVEGDDRIFPFKSKSVGCSFARACGMLGIDDLRFHDLRHECASWLFEQGLD